MTWHTVSQIEENVYLISEPIGAIEPRFGVKTVNMYLIIGQERAALIDSGMGIGNVYAEIRKTTSLPCMMLNTHYHWDHTGANHFFDEIAIHALEADLLEQEQDLSPIREALQSPKVAPILPTLFDPTSYRYIPKPATCLLKDNERIDLGDCTLEVLHSPGHSPGHVTYFYRSSHLLFTGDTAYHGPLYICYEDSDPLAFLESVKRMASLPNVEIVCPGHNDVISDRNWLKESFDFFEAAVTGKVKSRYSDDFVIGREFRFGDRSLWLPK